MRPPAGQESDPKWVVLLDIRVEACGHPASRFSGVDRHIHVPQLLERELVGVDSVPGVDGGF